MPCNGSGKASEVIAGVDWVAGNLLMPAVVSMSLGADTTDPILDAAVQAVIGLGATVVTAAGNFNNGKTKLAACLQFNSIGMWSRLLKILSTDLA